MSNQSLLGSASIDKKSKKYFLLFPVIMTLILLFRELDNDIWFLLTHGRYVLEHGIPYTEPFTIHEGFKFVMQQWLSAVIFFLTYSKFGEFGLKFLVIIAYIASMLIFFRLCLKLTNKNFIKSVLVTYIYIGLVNIFMTTRPFIFTNIVILLEIYSLESYYVEKNKNALNVLPVLSLVLINLQASMWPVLLVIIIPYVIDSFKFKIGPIKGCGVQKKSLFIVIFFVLLFGFLNPYGIDGMLYIKNSYGVPEINSLVLEMHPATVNSTLGLIIIASTTGLTYLYMFGNSSKRTLRYILLAIGTAYLSLSTIRGFIFFICCGIFPLSVYFDEFQVPQFDTKFPRRTILMRKILITLIGMMIPVLVYQNSIQKNESMSEREYFLSALEMVLNDKNLENPIIYTGYNDGGLAEFHFVTTYIDPRAEVFLKKNNLVSEIFLEYYNLQKGLLFYKSFLNKYNFPYLIVGKNDILYTYLENDTDYSLVASNHDYKVYRNK